MSDQLEAQVREWLLAPIENDVKEPDGQHWPYSQGERDALVAAIAPVVADRIRTLLAANTVAVGEDVFKKLHDGWSLGQIQSRYDELPHEPLETLLAEREAAAEEAIATRVYEHIGRTIVEHEQRVNDGHHLAGHLSALALWVKAEASHGALARAEQRAHEEGMAKVFDEFWDAAAGYGIETGKMTPAELIHQVEQRVHSETLQEAATVIFPGCFAMNIDQLIRGFTKAAQDAILSRIKRA